LRRAGEERRALADRAIPVGKLVYAEAPDAFVARLGAYWEAWRH
jgi:hypothetical protein